MHADVAREPARTFLGTALPMRPALVARGALAARGGLMAPAFLVAALASSLEAQSLRTEHTRTADPGAAPPAASIADVAWLAGRWVGEGLGATVGETWLPPAGGAMAGVFRVVRDGKVDFYEIVTLAEEGGSLVLNLKHFGPDLVGWEEREASVRFPLVQRDEDTFWFDGLTIRRTGPDRMRIWVALSEGGEEEREARFRYRRVSDSGTGPAPEGADRPALDWESATPLPAGRDHHATFVTGEGDARRLHLAGGTDYREVHATHWTAPVHEDGTLGAWTEATPLPERLAGLGVAVRRDGALVIGGQRPGLENVAAVWHAPLDERGLPGAWSPAVPLPAPRFHHTVSRIGEWVYVIGGIEERAATATVFRGRWTGEGGVEEWVSASRLPEPRSHHGAAVHDGALYVVGGQSGEPAGEARPLRTVLRAEPGEDGGLGPWSAVAELDSAFAAHAVFVHAGHLYVAGGVENNRRVTDRVLRAPLLEDGGLGPWRPSEPLPEPRSHVHHMPIVDGVVYSAGGSARRQVSERVFLGRWTGPTDGDATAGPGTAGPDTPP